MNWLHNRPIGYKKSHLPTANYAILMSEYIYFAPLGKNLMSLLVTLSCFDAITGSLWIKILINPPSNWDA